MHSAAHFASRLGAAQCPGIVAAGKRNTIANTNSCVNTDSYPYPNARPKPNSDAIRIMCPGVERHSDLYGRYDCERERRQLCR